MRLEDNPSDDGKRVWLNKSELNDVLAVYSGDNGSLGDDLERETAIRLMGMCGLRTAEMLAVTPAHLKTVETDDGELTKIRLAKDETKTSESRETVVPQQLASDLRTYERAYGIGESEPFVNVSRRTIQRWMNDVADHMVNKTADDDYRYLTAHDLRRAWAMRLLDSGTIPTVVMELGGWVNFKTFRDHYLGRHNDDTIARETASAF